jgi:hypothetical protein
MKRGIWGVTVVAIALTVPGVTASAEAAGLPDASCTVGPGVTIEQPNGDLRVAQTFTALHSGGLDTASTAVIPRSAISGDWKLEIASTSASAPGSVMATTTVPNTLPVNTKGTITGTFATPASVSAGSLYALLISRPGSNGYGVADQGGDPCAGQAYYQNVVAGPFIFYNGVDFEFATTVQPPTGPGAGASAGKKCKKKKRKQKKHAAAAKKKHKKCKKKKKKR